MQPTYLPWIGYFDLMDSCDLFVFYDCVQFDKRSWQQRNRIKTVNGEQYLTVPVFSKGRRDQKIRDVQIDRSTGFDSQHLRSIYHAYVKAPFYRTHVDQFAALLQRRHAMLADLNIELIEWLARSMGITTRTLRSSALPAQGDKVDRLMSICELVGAKHYLSPPGSRDYIEADNLFHARGMRLSYQQYSHPVYRQLHGDFVSHMSVLDLLFNEGDSALDILRSGRGGTV